MRRGQVAVLAVCVVLAVVGVGVVVSRLGRHESPGPPRCATRNPGECSTAMARSWSLPLASVPTVRTPRGLRFVNAVAEGGLAVDTKTMGFVAAPATFRFTFLGAHGRHLALDIGYGHATLVRYLPKLGTFATRSGHRYFGSARNPREYCLANFTDTRFFYSVDTWPGASHPGTAGCDEVDALIDAVQPPS